MLIIIIWFLELLFKHQDRNIIIPIGWHKKRWREKHTEHNDSLRHQQFISYGENHFCECICLAQDQPSFEKIFSSHLSQQILLQEREEWAEFILHPHIHNCQSSSFLNIMWLLILPPMAAPLGKLVLLIF